LYDENGYAPAFPKVQLLTGSAVCSAENVDKCQLQDDDRHR
jgi:hypothetical protein